VRGKKRQGDNAHAFLRIVRPVSGTDRDRRDDLQISEKRINPGRTIGTGDPSGNGGYQKCADKSENGRDKNEKKDYYNAAEHDRLQADGGESRADKAADERMAA